MAVITISRELGSEGTYIGRKAAEVLGYRYVDKRVIEDLLKDYGMVQFRNVYESAPGFWTRFDEMSFEIINMLNKIILALAQRGDMVILGRGGFAVLGGYSDVLNVRIQAPLATRVRRVMEREQFPDLQLVEELVKKNDRVRAAFIQTFYNIRWDLSTAFNVVIDTGSIAPDAAVHWIVEATRAVEKISFEEHEQNTRMIQVDPVLAEAIANIQEFN